MFSNVGRSLFTNPLFLLEVFSIFRGAAPKNIFIYICTHEILSCKAICLFFIIWQLHFRVLLSELKMSGETLSFNFQKIEINTQTTVIIKKPKNMKRFSLLLLGLVLTFVACNTNTEEQTKDNKQMGENPFFSQWGTPFEVPSFDKIKIEHYKPAFEKGIEEQAAKIDAIVNSKEAPTFQNTLEALENSGELLTKVAEVFYNQLSSNTSKEIQALAKEIAPMMSKHSDNINLNAKLFGRVKDVYENREKAQLNGEQMRLLTETYKGFVKSGANLDDTAKAELRKLNERLSVLSLKFGENQLAEDNGWKLVIDKKEDLAGLPEGVVASAAEAGKDAGQEGKWVITMHKPSWIPFLQYSDKRELREKVYKAWMNRGNNGNANDNKAVLTEISELRLKKAKVLGFDTWAAYVLDDRMARTPDAVNQLLNKLWEKALPMAKAEAAEMQKMIDKEGGKFKLASWDWWYYAEKIRKEKYALDDEMLRPYFELENVKKGVFHVLNKLWGLQMKERKDLPTPHKDAVAYEVLEADGSHIGILYMDFHPRASKKGGAWMSSYRKQSYKDGKMVTPVITNVFNFTKPTGDKPALLTFDEVSTTFHEIGHGLHGLLSNCSYHSLSGTAVKRDFVELPSQIMENWAAEPEVMKVYAKHYKTGEVISDELIEKMKASSKFNQGFATVEYLAASMLDLKWHTLAEGGDMSVLDFEEKSMDAIGLIEEIIPRYRSTYFSHIFAGGYSAGYYSYIWAEVLDADAFQAFKETGDIYNQEIAKLFRDNILSRGGTEDPMTLYKTFRGKEPEIDPLLKKRGLL